MCLNGCSNMLRIVVRAKKDGDAVKASLETFYKGWDIEVVTLKGEREPGRILERLQEIPGDRLALFLVGREDYRVLEVAPHAPLHVVVHPIKYKKVRNARTIVISREIEKGKAKARLGVSWDNARNVYLFDHRVPQLFSDVSPAYDVFLPVGEDATKRLEELLGVGLSQPLLLRKMGGVHDVYDCGLHIGQLIFPDTGRPSAVLNRNPVPCTPTAPQKIVNVNAEAVKTLENISLRFLESIVGVKRVYVPLSGGKDSAATLILATKVWGNKVRAVYVDTGVDFPQNRESAESLAASLGVELDEIYAPVREGIASKGLPTHEDRWCTGLKVAALHSYLKRQGADEATLVVVGDRDAESRGRSRRPPLRQEGNWRVAAPLKLWGSHHVLLYLVAEGVPLNPLYMQGFYRTGCYVCPSLRGWELYVMEKTGILEKLRKKSPSLLGDFLAAKEWLPGDPD